MAGGLADDLATTLLLATDKRVLVAPAMNVRMWLHPATRRNVERLSSDGVLFVGPDEGPMACGEFGPGRMAEPPAIVEAIEEALSADRRRESRESSAGPLAGRHVIVTSGPTYEADRSGSLPRQPLLRPSGSCNCAICSWRRRKGDVGHRSGRAARSARRNGRFTSKSAREMRAAVEAALPADAFIGGGGGRRLAGRRHVARQKIKKDGGGAADSPSRRKPRYSCGNLDEVQLVRPSVVIGFAAETENVVANAKAKLARKGCDLIVANSVAEGTSTFGGETNEVAGD